jgi:hypothetical protein
MTEPLVTRVADLGNCYVRFLEFVQRDLQKDRVAVHRKMFSVFLWGFLVPAGVVLLILVLVNYRILPMKARGMLDLVLLFFPVVYSIYILVSEVLVRLPSVFKKGGLSGVLDQSARDSVWREKVCLSMDRVLPFQPSEWEWVMQSFEIDLQSRLKYTRFITGLSGAIFFLMFQGVDLLAGGDVEARVSWSRNASTGMLESSTHDLSQIIALSLFLGLFYLAGVQNVRSLERYLDCARLLAAARKP